MLEFAPLEVILIGGTATQSRAYPTLCHVGKWFMDKRYKTHFIDGAAYINDNLTAQTPQQQAEEIRTSIPNLTDSKRRFLYITHCVGMAAAVALMSEDCGNSRLVALSPSLPTPYSTVMQPHFQKNITSADKNNYVPAYSWSDEPFKPTLNPSRIEAILPPSYMDTLERISTTFTASLQDLEVRGRVKLVIPRNDWNQPSVTKAQNFSNIMHVNANHSLFDQTFSHAPDALYRRIVNFALD